MSFATQFNQVFDRRVAELTGEPTSSPRHRWRIWLKQERQGEPPCFATSSRDTCQQRRCTHRAACMDLRAEWLR